MFEWDAKYSVGIGSIDAQHKTLFGLASDLNKAMTEGQAKAVCGKILERLIQYTATHFAHEERLMRLHQYGFVETHRAEHAGLTRRVVQFQADFQEGRVGLAVELLQFLSDWLANHILVSDQAYAPCLKGKAAAQGGGSDR